MTLRSIVPLILLGFVLVACARTAPAPIDYRITAVIERALRDDATRRAGVAQRQAQRELGDGPIYTVRSGDTLGVIADCYGVQAADIVRLNGLADPNRIFVGQPLMLPESARVQLAFTAPRPTPAAPAVVVDESAIPKDVRPQQVARAPIPASRPATQARFDQPYRSSGSQFDWPVRGRILQPFGPQGSGRVNDGINIAADDGAPVRAAAYGEVIYVGEEVKNLGNLLLIRHAEGWITAYAHTDTVAVRRGDVVRQGQPIARAGRAGGATGQVHFQLRRGTEPVDPMTRLPSLTG